MLIGVLMFSQTVTLSFTGRGSGGYMTEEIYQRIDSLQVRNITRDWMQMIYYPDTVVLLETLAVPMLDVKQSGLEQNVPNPFNCVTEAKLNLYEGDNVTMRILDASGKEYLSYSGKLPAGEHLFEITLAIPQTYFLAAETSVGKYMVKMVNLGSCGTNSLVLKSSSGIAITSKSLISDVFELGDQMEYLAYTTYNNRVFDASLIQEQNVSEDITIHFNIPYCNISYYVDTKYGCDFYNLNGVDYFVSTQNVETLRLTSAGGCDSIVIVDVVIDHDTAIEKRITSCEPMYWNGILCDVTGDYVANLFSQGGCDSIVTLHFTRADSIIHHIYDSDCISATWNNETFYETGEYIRHFSSQYRCDSIVHFHFKNLSDDTVVTIYACDEFTWINGRPYYGSNNTDTVHLVNSHGCDSIVRLNLILNRTGYNRIDRLACGQFYYNGRTYNNSGVYSVTLDNPYTGCDSIVELHLTVIGDTVVDIYENGCDSFTFDGHTYTETGVYDIHYQPNNFCDSIVRLHLTIGHNSYSEESVVACDSYMWWGEEYTASGDYEHVITWGNHEGCDSIITLHLTINNSVTREKTINACRIYMLEDERITESCTRVITYTGPNGCDSTVTYHINIFGDIETEFTQYACGSFVWEGDNYTATGNYTKHLTPVLYCDSIVTMHLFIGSPNNEEDDQTACDSYEWEGITYTESGNYARTLTNIYGCDSLVTLHLTINHSYNVTDSKTACDYYEWEGTVYRESGSYTKTLQSIHGCDSVVVLNLTVKYSVEHEFSDTLWGPYDISEGSPYDVFRSTYLNNRLDTLGPKIWNDSIYTRSGDYQQTFPAANGCDSIVTLHLVYHERIYDTRDGNTYLTLEYGNKVWTTENMRYLPQVVGPSTSSNSLPYYYVYGYSNSNNNVTEAKNMAEYSRYGVLYNWKAAMNEAGSSNTNPSGVQGVCPDGWHIPSKVEWEELVAFLGSNPEYTCNNTAVNVAKAIASTEDWNTSTTDCAVGNDRSLNNASGFTGLPGGQKNAGGFSGKLDSADWWTATESGANSAYREEITKDSKTLGNSGKAKGWAFSVRCVKD